MKSSAKIDFLNLCYGIDWVAKIKVCLVLTIASLFGMINSSNAQGYNTSKNDKSLYNFVEIYQTLTNDSLTIESLLSKEKTFHHPEKYNYYEIFSDSTFWIKLPIKNNSDSTKKMYFVLENSYLQNADFWIVKNQQVIHKGHHHNYQRINQTPRLSNYPTWTFSLQKSDEAIIYMRIIDTETRTRLKIELFDDSGFSQYKLLQTVYLFAYTMLILIVVLIVVIFSIASKDPRMLFYAAYLFFFIIDNVAFKGFGQTYIWNDSLYLINNIRSLSHGLIFFFLALFLAHFYRQLNPPKWVITYFILLALIILPFFIFYFIKIFDDSYPNFYRYFWQFLNFNIVGVFLVHVFLTVKKKIPVYLSVAFALPIIGSQFRNNFVPNHTMGDMSLLLVDNAYFYSVIIEILMISYFVIRSSYNRTKDYKENILKHKDLEKELESLKQQQDKDYEQVLVLKSKAAINIDDLIYIKSDGHYLDFYLNNRPKPEIDRNTLKDIERLLPKYKFVRIHKSTIVNIDYVRVINSSKLMLENGTCLNISRTFKSNTRNILIKK